MSESARDHFKKIYSLALRLKQTACVGLDADQQNDKLDAILQGQLSIAAIFQTFGELLTGEDCTNETLFFLEAQVEKISKIS